MKQHVVIFDFIQDSEMSEEDIKEKINHAFGPSPFGINISVTVKDITMRLEE